MEWSLKKKRTYISRNIWYSLDGSWYRKQSGATERMKKLVDDTAGLLRFKRKFIDMKNKSMFDSNNIHSQTSLN